jgi:nucleotide-binding universal stress UspA family protein
VLEPPTAYSAGDFAVGLPMTDDASRAALEDVQVPDPKVPVTRHLLDGEPSRAIIRFAEAEDVDLIVMGTHGRGGLRRLLMGSVAEGVVRGAPCPVLTYRPKAEQEAATPRL